MYVYCKLSLQETLYKLIGLFQAQLQNQMQMLMLTGGILGSGIQASLQDVLVQSQMMTAASTNNVQQHQATQGITAQSTGTVKK